VIAMSRVIGIGVGSGGEGAFVIRRIPTVRAWALCIAILLCTAASVWVGTGLAQVRSTVPGHDVAAAAGMPITRATFDHWMRIAARGSASQSRGAALVIVPTDPPRFAGCIAQVRARIPKLLRTSTPQIRRDCRQLFTVLMRQVLDFLIKADWYQGVAALDHIVITNSQVAHRLAADKRTQFSTPAAYQRFLALTGQTNRDIVFRVRINLVYEALIKKVHGHAQLLDQNARKAFGPSTSCARYYLMADCVGYLPDGAAP
jgi:hypothetical protein